LTVKGSTMSVKEPDKAWECEECGERKEGNKRPPRTWRRVFGRLICGQCDSQLYFLRAITIPVVKPVSVGWDEFRDRVKVLWSQTTAAANWMVTEFYNRDCRRDGQEKLPPLGDIYLNPEARELFPDLPSNSLAALETAQRRKYQARRFELIWLRSVSLPSHRYPIPFPVHKRSWSARFENDRPVVAFQWERGRNSDRCEVMLRGGKRYALQRASFGQIVTGEAEQGELAIVGKRNSDRRWEIFCKLVARFPRKTRSGLSGVLLIQSATDALLMTVGDHVNPHPWVINADHIRRWVMTHRTRLKRLAQDSKALIRSEGIPFKARRAQMCEKQRDRMNTATHQLAREVARYVERGGYARVEYDDREQGFCREFPWAELQRKLQEKLGRIGVEFKHLKKVRTRGEMEKDWAGIDPPSVEQGGV
jgi:hypothetical protein